MRKAWEMNIYRELPIIFSTEMVRAILDGRKTQTRRVIKPQPEDFKRSWKGWRIETPPELGRITSPHPKRGKFGVFIRNTEEPDFPMCDIIVAPYESGDLLYVRETWAPKQYQPQRIYYAADCELGSLVNLDGDRWRPSIHMPKAAARIWLRVKNVHVERVQDITNQDAIAEGVQIAVDAGLKFEGGARDAFATLWDSINGKRASWQSNPWVWVIEFERIDR